MSRLFPPYHGGSTAVGLLAVRLAAGAAMMLHGWPKIQNATSWMGDKAPVPAALQAAAAVAEFGGGICWMLGLLTPLFSFLLLCTMATAAFFHISNGDPFVASGPGQASWELATVYFSVAILTLLAGPGVISLDYAMFGARRRIDVTS